MTAHPSVEGPFLAWLVLAHLQAIGVAWALALASGRSLPRLREAVSASGMDLASVWVSGGWNERNRGNPTPGQPDDPVPLALNEGGGEQAVGGAPPRDPRGLGGVLRPGAVDILI